MEDIASFKIDHDVMSPGFYYLGEANGVYTYDLRFKTPNGGDYMDSRTMHSVEHMLATLLRNGEIGESVIYFGPMGCRTGFYLLTRDLAPEAVKNALKKALADTVAHKGPVFGATRKECGNYLDLDIDDAKRECAAFLAVLEQQNGGFDYAT